MTYNLEDFTKWITTGQSQILTRINFCSNLNAFADYYSNNPDQWEKVLFGIENSTLRKTIVDEWILSLEKKKINLVKNKLTEWTQLISKTNL